MLYSFPKEYTMPLNLNGPQERELSQAMRDAFPDPDRLDEVLRYYLDKQRVNITLKTNYESRLYDILVDAKAKNWTDKLLVAAREANPESPALIAFAAQFGLATTTRVDNATTSKVLNDTTFQRKIRDANSYLDVLKWRSALGRLEGQICRIESPHGTGTGFLLGNSVVMTNYHVMKTVIEGAGKPDKVVLRFDYKKLDNDAVNQGTVYELDDEWLIDSSKYSDADLIDPPPAPPSLDTLDYALLRVKGAPGKDPIGGKSNADPKAAPRGFIPLPGALHDFMKFPAVFIMQHPDGAPLTLALDTEAVISVTANGSRVRYRTNTEPGSSGSPCFDANWNLIALHHAGDPKWTPTYNQGIPFMSILNGLKADVRGELGV